MNNKLQEDWKKEFDELTDWMDSAHGPLNKDLDKIKSFISKLLSDTEKAYGGCHKCYGKGYSTYRHGLSSEPDFEGDNRYEDPPKTHMIYCSCDRGKQLQLLKGVPDGK